MSLEQKIDTLIEQVFLVAGKVDQRAKVNEQNNAKASQTIAQAGQAVNSATQVIQRITSQTIENAVQKPVADLDHSLQIMKDNLVGVANSVEQHMKKSIAKFKHVTTIAIGALIFAGVVILGVSTYAVMQSNQKLKQADWVGGINAAVANGKLAACPDGGVCAMIDKKPVRLDK